MATREDIARRGVRPEDVDDVVEIAAELQARRDASADEVDRDAIRRVAAEVDVDPALVDEAIAELQQRRAQAERDEAAAKARVRRAWKVAAAIALPILLLSGGMTVAAGNDLAEAREGEAEAAALLSVQLERQASLAPQVLALAGARPELADEIAAVRDAKDLDARVAASETLGDALTGALAELPPPTGDAEAQMRLNLSYELTGTQNRITTAAQRHEAAEGRLDAASDGVFATMADVFGLD